MFAKSEPESLDPALLETFADGELIRLVKRGDDNALGVLLRRHHEALYRFCLHLTSNHDDAEDVSQESMARAITRLDTLQTGSAFRGWLFSIARNLSIDSHRRRRRLVPLPDEEIGPLPLPLHDYSPYERLETNEEYQTVAQALSKLKKNHQTVLMLREVEGLSYAEIARRLDLSESAVETLLFRARRRLREEYSRSAFPIPALAFLGGLRTLAGRLASPFSGAPLAAKVAAGALVIGGAAIGTPHLIPVLHDAASGIGGLVAAPTALSPHASVSRPSHTGITTPGGNSTRPAHGSTSHRAGSHTSASRVGHHGTRDAQTTPIGGQRRTETKRGQNTSGLLGSPARHGHAGNSAVTGASGVTVAGNVGTASRGHIIGVHNSGTTAVGSTGRGATEGTTRTGGHRGSPPVVIAAFPGATPTPARRTAHHTSPVATARSTPLPVTGTPPVAPVGTAKVKLPVTVPPATSVLATVTSVVATVSSVTHGPKATVGTAVAKVQTAVATLVPRVSTPPVKVPTLPLPKVKPTVPPLPLPTLTPLPLPTLAPLP